MYKDKTKQTEAARERKRRQRGKGVTLATEGVTLGGLVIKPIEPTDLTRGMMDCPDILNKLTNPFWRGRLEKICSSFQNSHHPDYKHDVWLGNYNLADVCGMLECTR